MNKLLQGRCKNMVLDYQKNRDGVLRNKLFDIMRPFLEMWLKSSLNNHKRYQTKQEITSMSWDLFVRGLDTYRDHFPLAKHFSLEADKLVVNTRSRERLEKKKVVSVEEVAIETLEAKMKCDPCIYSDVMILKEFRECLPEEYKIVFDDALCSMDNAIQYRQNRAKESGLPAFRYYEAKRLFKLFITFLFK